MRNEPNDSVVLTATSSAVISNRPCIVSGLVLAPGTAVSAVSLYDPPENTTTTTSATLRVTLNGAANDSAVIFHCDGGLVFNNGCVAVVTGTSSGATVAFAKI